MYAFIRGKLDRKSPDSLIVDANGLGFFIHTGRNSIDKAGAVGSDIKVYTYTYVREDTLALYGFLTEEELRMFEQLLSITGVGPKAACAVVGTVSPSQFGLAVLTEDADRLTKAPGIGKKTALRIILELKDKLKKEQPDLGVWQNQAGDTVTSGDSRLGEAVSALMMLGYSGAEAQRAVADTWSDEKPLEALVKDALRRIGSFL